MSEIVAVIPVQKSDNDVCSGILLIYSQIRSIAYRPFFMLSEMHIGVLLVLPSMTATKSLVTTIPSSHVS